MGKFHRCPDCGRSHAGFTELCGDCLDYGSRLVEGSEAQVAGITPLVTIMGGKEANNVTHRGRPRQYRNNAERQAAYRGRHDHRDP